MQAWCAARSDICFGAADSSSGDDNANSAGSSVACWAHPAVALAACASKNLVWRPAAALESQQVGLSCGGGGMNRTGLGSGNHSMNSTAGGPLPPAVAPLPPAARGPLREWLGAVVALRQGEVRRACGAESAIVDQVLLVHRYDTINTFHSME
ncbi:hypothetical protein MNEG_4721 [Monoraphidium neglectum]|uniref:Uncharacterized protein n=1 Tax=Monoraphidium neglectum TaxID=145388 RepID=A0A0D2JX97_9CHLO|nr:hypothetical protein MNEG_4721 [Monoraphidium neglectum]KIZ03238.1 hypothetical protein MNEG_4721 [Monoraphidium neglectum]|eukprot:XP_013902257.1 hypothetical protein MNEG_4721 [Monoraphidium neglectum]